MKFKVRTACMIVVSACGLVLAASAAQAQMSDAQKSALRSNCRSDYMANCMSVPPGTKEALECLQQHLASLSPACKNVVSETMPPPPPAAAPPPPPPPAAAAPPPPPPPAAMAPPPPRSNERAKEAIKTHCRSDFMARCRGVTPGGRAALECLQRHVRELSHACRIAVEETMPKHPRAMRKEKERAAQHVAPPPPPPPPGPDPAVVMAKAAHLSLRDRLAIIRACDQDQAAVCPRERRGGGRIIFCLAMHPQALSPYCRRTLLAIMR